MSAFVAENHLTLGEIAVPEKSSEITAIPELLDLVDVEGDIAAINALVLPKGNRQKDNRQKAD